MDRLYQRHCFPCLDEGIDGKIQISPSVGGGDLGADAGLAFGDNWTAESNHIDAFVEQGSRKIVGQFGIANHDGNDGMAAFDEIESRLRHFRPEVVGVLLEPVSQ